MSEWISVEDRLPDIGEQVFILVNGNKPTVGSRDDEYSGSWRIGNDAISWDYDFSFGVEMDVTHWMPLPEPPKEGE